VHTQVSELSSAGTAENPGTPDSQGLWAPVIADLACPTTRHFGGMLHLADNTVKAGYFESVRM